jgi:hypothetical protein
MNAMHFKDSLTARALSVGDGMPPCNVWPRLAERASNKEPPSSWNIFVRTSDVYTSDDRSFLHILGQLYF